MAALAYLFPPLSGLIAYLRAERARTRFHGLQAVVFGALWPAVLFACSLVTPGATQVAFAVGGLVWLLLLALTAIGRDVRFPLVGAAFESWAQEGPATRS